MQRRRGNGKMQRMRREERCKEGEERKDVKKERRGKLKRRRGEGSCKEGEEREVAKKEKRVVA